MSSVSPQTLDRPSVSRAARAEHGFTLVELLVAMVTGLVVLLATFSVLDISLSQSSRISERVDADQRGRLAMEKILLELHSSCVSSAFTPILSGSESSSISFISQAGAEAAFTHVTKHVITLSSSGSGTLTDASYVSNGGSTPNWTFPSTATSTQNLLTGVSQSTTSSGASIAAFQYFKYEGGNLSSTALSTPLSSSNAKATAEVTVSFTTKPSSGRVTGNRTIDLTNTAVLRYSPASSAGANEPCK